MFGLSSIRLYVFLGMVLAIVLLGATSAVLWSRLGAKQAVIVSLTQQRDLAAGDAARWQGAAAQRQGVIDKQTQALRRLESDGQAARAIAAANTEKAEQRIAALEARISHLKETAHARPDDVRPLGPIVRDALPGLQH
ncbi:hypothetical protein [Dongia sp.]|uniref:hypothetical protein n=1 Tax=Dongia sp. TaxID=1977262 RepID=UPI0037513ECF